MNNNCSSKQWVARYHMDVLIKTEIGRPFIEQLFYTSCHIKIERQTNYRKIKIITLTIVAQNHGC